MMKKKQSRNFLELSPVRCPGIRWEQGTDGQITLFIPHNGWMDKAAQKLFGKPAVTQVHMDEQGSFLWPLLDGSRTVEQLAALQKEKFGEAVEPLYPRIVKFFQIMEANGFITLP